MMHRPNDDPNCEAMELTTSSASAVVVAVIASYRRPAELRRLLESLGGLRAPLEAVVVTDNGNDKASGELLATLGPKVTRLVPGKNLGCGGGLKFAIDHAIENYGDRLTHVWILDDDAVVGTDTLERLLVAGEAARADVIYPMIVDGRGRIGWFPGLLRAEPWRVIREVKTPAEYVERCGADPVPFSWCPGVCLLVSARALRSVGPPRGDYWVRGEDLEFSLRLTARYSSAFVPTVVVSHLQPPPSDPLVREGERIRYLAMMQNLGYTGFRLPHGRRMLRTLPGNSLRFLRAHGWTPGNLAGLGRALWLGAVRGFPAGDPRGNALQQAADH
jgi:rhamnopyranosyl-N-acetylglucosaminyl-diphospho-decaprenol beta-1,3/1,4-galactofuranosyltransferase